MADMMLKILIESLVISFVAVVGVACSVCASIVIDARFMFGVPVVLVIGLVVLLWQIAKKTK